MFHFKYDDPVYQSIEKDVQLLPPYYAGQVPTADMVTIQFSLADGADRLLAGDTRRLLQLSSSPVNGTFGSAYVSYYMAGEIVIVTHAKERSTVCCISPKYVRSNTRLFISSLVRQHMYRHLNHHQLYVLHAGTIVDHQGRGYIIFGDSGAGKTTLIMDAVQKLGFRYLTDDRTIYDRSRGVFIGNPAHLNLLSDKADDYCELIAEQELIQGGANPKLRVRLREEQTLWEAPVVGMLFLHPPLSLPIVRECTPFEAAELIRATQQEHFTVTEKKNLHFIIGLLQNLPSFRICRSPEQDSVDLLSLLLQNDWLAKGTGHEGVVKLL